MSISNEALHKLAREIETQAAAAQHQIGLTRSQIAAKQREQRLARLTLSELGSLPDEVVIYEGLQKESKDLDTDVEKLNQRLLYLETTHNNSREHIEKILRTH
ncbi:hypothetical protein E4U55_001231 [Claviceps digitariae]|nr:hypothetical protein E4U55_001231 [Claviceps digitariae]